MRVRACVYVAAKYEITKGFTMTSGLGTTVQSIMSATDCAAQCDQYRVGLAGSLLVCLGKYVNNNTNEYLERLTRTGPKRLHTFSTNTYCQNSTHTT